jgi:hypothetical protein
VKRVRSRSARLSCLLLLMSIACAVSGIVLDLRVMSLLSQARAGTVLQSQLERADEVATLLLFFTLVINAACVLACLAWSLWLAQTSGRSVAARVRWFVVLAVLAIPLANPIAPFAIRGHEDGLTFAIVARALGVCAAVAALTLVRRASAQR